MSEAEMRKMERNFRTKFNHEQIFTRSLCLHQKTIKQSLPRKYKPIKQSERIVNNHKQLIRFEMCIYYNNSKLFPQ